MSKITAEEMDDIGFRRARKARRKVYKAWEAFINASAHDPERWHHLASKSTYLLIDGLKVGLRELSEKIAIIEKELKYPTKDVKEGKCRNSPKSPKKDKKSQ